MNLLVSWIYSVCGLFSQGPCDFPPHTLAFFHSSNMHVRLTGVSKLAVDAR